MSDLKHLECEFVDLNISGELNFLFSWIRKDKRGRIEHKRRRNWWLADKTEWSEEREWGQYKNFWRTHQGGRVCQPSKLLQELSIAPEGDGERDDAGRKGAGEGVSEMYLWHLSPGGPLMSEWSGGVQKKLISLKLPCIKTVPLKIQVLWSKWKQYNFNSKCYIL